MVDLIAPEIVEQKSQGGIRPCTESDFAQVTGLFQQAFPKNLKLFGNDLENHFEKIYLNNPWADDKYQSLVFEKNGEVDGFIGIIPRKMRFRGRPITAAVSSMLMVKPDASGNRNPLTGISLMRRFLSGPQDLSLTDTANDTTRTIWEACGGSIAYPYCYSWIRPLRPMQTFLRMGTKSPLLRCMATPATRLADIFAHRLPPIKTTKPSCSVRDIDSDRILELSQMVPGKSIMPEYASSSLQWLMDMAETSVSEGTLAKREVRSSEGKPLGWYVYFRNKNGIGRVLQLVAFPRMMEIVLESLLYEAKHEGVAALKGRTDPENISLLSKNGCSFTGRPWFLVHSKDQEIVRSFQSTDVFFTGFEGENWMKVNAV